MKRLVLPALAVALSSACIVYDEDVIYNEHGEYGDTDLGTWSNPERPASEDPAANDDGVDDPPEAPPPVMHFEPGGALAGDIVIVSLVSDDDSLDLRKVDTVEFFGAADIDVLAMTPRNAGEFLLTLDIDPDGFPGVSDALIAWSDGTAVFLEGAFEVVDDPSDIPESETSNNAGSSSGSGNGGDEGDCGCP
jgi:hypothetical protein